MRMCRQKVGGAVFGEEAQCVAVQDGGRGGGEEQDSGRDDSEAQDDALWLMLIDVGEQREKVTARRSQDEGERDSDEDADKRDQGGQAGQLPGVEKSPSGQAASFMRFTKQRF